MPQTGITREGVEGESMNKLGRIGVKLLSLMIVSLCILASGCKDATTIWSTESGSPDGRWIASAHTDQYGGPGAAGILSTVTLRQVKGRQDKIEVLQLSQN